MAVAMIVSMGMPVMAVVMVVIVGMSIMAVIMGMSVVVIMFHLKDRIYDVNQRNTSQILPVQRVYDVVDPHLRLTANIDEQVRAVKCDDVPGRRLKGVALSSG